MRLGIGLGYSGAQIDFPFEMVERAERLGFASVWVSETYGSDAITPLAFIGARTQRIQLGTSVAQLAARTPANLAMSAQTIDAMAGEGRMIVGLGMSGPQVVEGWYGQPWGKPNYLMRDYVAIMKKIWKREAPLSHQGRQISLPYTGDGALGVGKPLKSILHGNPDIPVYLGTSSELNVAMTAEVADGWLLMHFAPGDLARHRPVLERGMARRRDGMTMEKFVTHAVLQVSIDDDVGAAIQAAKPGIALYVGGMGAKEMNFHKDAMVRRGYAEAANRIQELWLAGRKEEAANAVPDEYVDSQQLVGPPARIMERWPAWRDSGLTSLHITRATPDVVELFGRHAL
jgi:F420-dependent oxidoreductase-like protein